MESIEDPRTALRIVERAGAAPYIDYPPTPRWYPFAVGVWAALMVLACDGASSRPAVFIPVIVLLVAAEGAFFAWYRRYMQTWPSMRSAPREINAAYRRYAVGAVSVLAVCVAVFVLIGPVVCAVVTFALVAAGLALYERTYAAAATATRNRLQAGA
jgi:hypothetical protein